MDYPVGIFGVLNHDRLDPPPMILYDGGIERRFREPYDFTNYNRPGYHGYLFQYTLSGCGCYERNKTPFLLEGGMGFFVRIPENSRYYLPESVQDPWTFLYLHFDGFAVSPFADRLEDLCNSPFSLSISSRPVRMALLLQERMMKGTLLKPYEGGEFLYQFLSSLLRELEYPKDTKDNIIDLALKQMDAEYSTLTSIEALAGSLQISASHLTRSFQARMHMSPIQYLTNLRIQASIHSLLNTNKTLDEIAEENGFSNGNYFGKVFRKQTGLTPTEYRRRRKSPI